jgi:class 3 adenylate cyclase/predicted ATPase
VFTGAEEPTQVHLTLLAQGGTIAASLTDLEGIARLEAIAVADATIRALERESVAWLDPALEHSGGAPLRAAASRLCDFGLRLFGGLLPAGIGAFLRDGPPRTLSLQIDPSLAWVPWELAFDGESFVGEKFRVCRRIVTDAQPRPAGRHGRFGGASRVLILSRRAHASSDPAHSLVARLRIGGGLLLSTANIEDLGPAELLRLIEASDLVHSFGAVAGGQGDGAAAIDIGALGALASLPVLWVAHAVDAPMAGSSERANTALATSASRLGLNLLTCEETAADEPGADFIAEMDVALRRGARIDEAVRCARARVHEKAGIAALAALRPELYGDGATVLRPRDQLHGEDDLRQVTTLSIDLVESTRLMARLGAERYSDLLSEYHRLYTRIVRSLGGVPDDPQGNDGAMCYFGVPVAREDAAVQALRAALEVIDAVKSLGARVRIGVCTGQVVVRDGQPVGSAVHLAARLQSIARPQTVVVGESTRRIVKDRFRFQRLEDPPLLKGFDQPQLCYELLGPALPSPRLDVGATGVAAQTTPFVGRREELLALQGHWAEAHSGSLQLVRVVGEAGIGKSRLVREFRSMLAEEGRAVVELRCAPEHVHSAFRPLIDFLRRELRINASDTGDAVLERLRQLVSPAEAVDQASVALLADLLAIELPARHPILERTAERRRRLTVDLLVALAQQRLRGTAACLVVEDVHWVDPSTAEFLNRLAGASPSMPLLILVTERSDAERRWHPRTGFHEIELRGLSPGLARTLVVRTCGAHRLPNEVVHRIAERADGVPLFIEESTRMAIDLGERVGGAAALPVPETIVDLLAARLDSLGGAKPVAQVAGTIGREFSLRLLQAVLDHPEAPISAPDASAQLQVLVRAGMLLARRDDGPPRFVFKHALMRDAAHRSLLDRDRLRLHRVIASVIREQFGDLAEQQPELLAFHYTEAGMDAEALRCWESAARQAASRSANLEAIGHINSALAVLARVSPGVDRDRVELRLQLLLAARFIATHGYGAERVERAYARAMALAEALGDGAALMRVLLGLEGYHFMRADFAQAKRYVLDAATRAGSGGGAIHRVQTQWALANIVMHQGEMEAAVRQMDACRAEYERLEHRSEAVQDPGVMCLCYSAWSLWQLGFPDEALQRVIDVVVRAERLGHKFSIGEGHGFRAAVRHFRGENRAALESAERAIEICEDGGFSVWLAHARVMRGRIVADLGDAAAGIEEMRQGYELWDASGAVVTTPFYLALRAEGLALDHRPDEAMALLEAALAVVNRTGERYYEAEIRRLIGLMTLQIAARARHDRSAEAEAWLLQAYECAQARKLASLSLRAATSLAELWLEQRRGREAIEVLEPALQAISGGAGTRDVATAHQRLAALHGAVAR